jgi:hypothetical protein
MHASAWPIDTGSFILNDLPGTPYSLRRKITLDVEQGEDGVFVVSEPTTGMFNYDAKWSNALEGFVRAFVNQFEFLSSKESNLSALMIAELEQFRRVIVSRT